MGFTQQTVGQWQRLQLGNRHVDGIDVVAHLAPVVTFFRSDQLLAHHRLIHGGLRAFDSAGLVRLLGDVHFDKQIDIRHDERKRIQLAQGPRGLL